MICGGMYRCAGSAEFGVDRALRPASFPKDRVAEGLHRAAGDPDPLVPANNPRFAPHFGEGEANVRRFRYWRPESRKPRTITFAACG